MRFKFTGSLASVGRLAERERERKYDERQMLKDYHYVKLELKEKPRYLLVCVQLRSHTDRKNCGLHNNKMAQRGDEFI